MTTGTGFARWSGRASAFFAASRGRLTRLAPVGVGVVSLSVYLLTLVREVDWGDPAELALQAYRLGVTHPPGYPVHTFLGKIATLFFAEPALGTNVLSALCTAVAVGLLCWIAIEITHNWPASLAAALAFGLTPLVWESAVVTEVYNVNICLVALGTGLLVAWRRRSSTVMLFGAAAVLGVSLGTYLANLLFIPALTALVLYQVRGRWRPAAGFLAILLAAGALVVSWSYFRSAATPPTGSAIVPDTPQRLIQYLSGTEYGTTSVLSWSFYFGRLVEHGLRFAKSFLGLGIILGLVGLAHLLQTQRPLGLALLAIFAINFGYFTGYGVPDYYTMVTPSYFVFALWIASGIAFLAQRSRGHMMKAGLAISCAALVCGLFVWKLPPRLARSRRKEVTSFVLHSFDVLPENAVVISNWRRFSSLLYFQTTRDLRPDLVLLHRYDEPRHYDSVGTVHEWREYVRGLADSTPVFLDRIDIVGPGVQEVSTINGTWHQIVLSEETE